ncbi:unnamed protein product [Darwinula stevensoni]|uniref:Uncharacterized protein n=1 Tax=Darwinula stevensoni TaxID=69355 RepID=A0A7R9A238_9CRUS|nr:unnamed protein product [Darwinula stevensoni]CAG0879071.1 unnamed protein product [Darwinula stevensoni]
MTNLMSSSERPGNKVHEGLEERGEPTTGTDRLRTGRAQAKLHPEMGIRDTRKVANHMDLLSLANFYNEMKLNTIGDYIISTGEAQRRNSEDAVPIPMDGYGAMEDRESGRALQQNNILPEIRTRGKSLPPSRGSDS